MATRNLVSAAFLVKISFLVLQRGRCAIRAVKRPLDAGSRVRRFLSLGRIALVSRLQANDRRAPAAGGRRGVVKHLDPGKTFEHSPHLRPLDTLAASVNEAHQENVPLAARLEVLEGDGSDIAWGEGVKVQLSGDGKDDGLG